MTINNINGSAAPNVRGGGQNERVENPRPGVPGQPTGKADTTQDADQVELTGQTQRLRELEASLGTEPAFDAKRVEALREAIAKGDYQVNPERVAKSLVDVETQLFKD